MSDGVDYEEVAERLAGGMWSALQRAVKAEAALARVEALQHEWWLSDDPDVEYRADALRAAIDG